MRAGVRKASSRASASGLSTRLVPKSEWKNVGVAVRARDAHEEARPHERPA